MILHAAEGHSDTYVSTGERTLAVMNVGSAAATHMEICALLCNKYEGFSERLCRWLTL